MSAQLKPIKVRGQGGPNPPKVAILLNELGLPYEIDPISFADVKKPEYLAINPNGRIPAIHDPNRGLTQWESGAIIEYLIEVYDATYQLGFAPGTPESFLAKQWLFFQVSGQGPYYGQAGWFLKFHAEKIPSAIKSYINEVNRVTGLLEGRLAQQKQKYGTNTGDGQWLVGNKYSFADIVFLSWQRTITKVTTKEQFCYDCNRLSNK